MTDKITLYDIKDFEPQEYVKVVRCKECKHHKDEEPGMVYCPKVIGSWVLNNDFCSWGERKDGDEE